MVLLDPPRDSSVIMGISDFWVPGQRALHWARATSFRPLGVEQSKNPVMFPLLTCLLSAAGGRTISQPRAAEGARSTASSIPSYRYLLQSPLPLQVPQGSGQARS